ncbi:hypothetical protein EK599_07440 [Vibrio sp. T187]|uniref:hypothetical protein n=1 Tax=Vibrio TaxID=662 RepID=UPI0010C93EC4|nr:MULTISPECIES: hypothetical protein [Vibrio]MBW3695524.1 hypothetical protein [Vibrio sp. T187]
MKMNGFSLSIIGFAAMIALQGCGGEEGGGSADGGTASPLPSDGYLPGVPGVLNVCNNQINDSDNSNAKGVCLKVAALSGNVYYTSSPSVALLNDQLYYDTTSTYTESSKGPAGGTFATFDHTERNSWCDHLQNKNFAGRGNWVQAGESQLVQLRDAFGSNIYNQLGWPSGVYYSGPRSVSGRPGQHVMVDLSSGGFAVVNSGIGYVSCVSH